MTLLTSLNFLSLRVVCRWTCMHVLILPPGPINIPTSYSRTSFIRVKLRALHSLWEQSGQDIKKKYIDIYICIGPLDKSHKPHSTFKNGIDAVLAMLSLFFLPYCENTWRHTRQIWEKENTKSTWEHVVHTLVYALQSDRSWGGYSKSNWMCVCYSSTPHIALTFEYFTTERECR